MLVDSTGPREAKSFFSISTVFVEGAARPAPEVDVKARISTAAQESVAAHLIADVEVGLFLSAGVDSAPS